MPQFQMPGKGKEPAQQLDTGESSKTPQTPQTRQEPPNSRASNAESFSSEENAKAAVAMRQFQMPGRMRQPGTGAYAPPPGYRVQRLQDGRDLRSSADLSSAKHAETTGERSVRKRDDRARDRLSAVSSL